MKVLTVTRHAVLAALAASLLSSCAAYRPAQEYRRAAAARRGRQSDRAAGLQAGADADAGGAAGLLQSQFAVAQRLARLLQGPARAPDRRHPHRQGQHHRQGQDRQRDPAQPQPTPRIPASPISSAASHQGADHERDPVPGRILTANSTASSDGKGSVNRQEALQTNVAARGDAGAAERQPGGRGPARRSASISRSAN